MYDKPSYERIVKDYTENDAVCFDRFHIMQTVQKAVDATRKSEQHIVSQVS